MRAKAEKKGFVIITVALLLVILLAFSSLAIDVGMFYAARPAAQHSADSAALAGAYTFVFAGMAPQPSTAQSHALNAALNSKIMASSILAGDVTIQVDVPNQRVTVDIAHTERAYLFSVLGISSGSIRVQAVAEAALNAVGTGCAKPWFIPNTMLSSAGLCGTGSACATNQVMILPNGGGVNHAFVDQYLGQPWTIKPGNPQASLAPGQFYAIRLGDSTGGSDYRTNIATCASQIVTCQNTYGVEPGNMIGPTMQGVLDLIGNPPDTWNGFVNGVPTFNPGSGGPATVSSRSVVVAPIWDICSMGAYCDSHGNFRLPDTGATLQIPVVGFALMFIQGVQGNDVVALLLDIFDCGSLPPANDQVTGPFSVPVRLVRAP